VVEVAQMLKLGPRQVEALESEDWQALPGNTMIRGFVRNYARVLNLDPEPLMQGLDAAHLQRTLQLDVSAGTRATLPQVTNRVQRRDYLAVLAGLLVLALAAVAYFFVPPNLWQGKLSSERPISPAPAEPLPAAASPAVPAAATGESVTPIAPPNATVLSDGGAASERSPAQETLAVPSGSGLKFTFAQAAWVEVRDAAGRLLLSELSPAGSRREVLGQPPFALVVGNASEVTLEYKGRVVDLLPRNKGVARLTLE
jgi:cytoskeleton protein RodZ